MQTLIQKFPKLTDIQKENVCLANIKMRKLILDFNKNTQQNLVENIPKEESFIKELEELIKKKEFDKCFELLYAP